MAIRNAVFTSALLLAALFVFVEATHFRYGTIEWFVADPARPNVITFRVNTAWRNSFFNAALNSDFNPGSLCFRNGGSCVSMVSKKTNQFLTDDWMTGAFGPGLGLSGSAWIHEYPAQDGTYTVSHTGCCRISSLKNNADRDWRIEATVKIKMDRSILRSAVSNTLPIVAVASNSAAATYTLSTTPSQPGGKLTFRMATSNEMGGSQNHPSTLAIADSSTGRMTIDTTRLVVGGLYHTQQIITDVATGTTIPIDYLLQVVKVTTFCNPACSNRLHACTKASDCINCGSIPDNQKCVSSQPQLVTAQLAASGVTVNPIAIRNLLIREPGYDNRYIASPGEQLVIEVIAHDVIVTDPSKIVTIYSGSLPPGATVSSQISCSGAACSCPSCNNPQRVTFRWTPTANDLGDYGVCFGVRSADKTELPYSQHCVIISVGRPVCGAGSLTPGSPKDCETTFTSPPCACTCPTGFSAPDRCLQCLPDHYGQKCTKCPNCNNGKCADGLLGSGVCICNPGYVGINCEKEQKDWCSSSAASVLLNSVSSQLATVNPVTARLLLSENTALTYDYSVTVSVSKPLIDIVILQDLCSGTTSQDIVHLQTYIGTLFSSLGEISVNPHIGIGSFNHLSNGYSRVSALSSDAASLKSKFGSLTSGLTPNSPGYALHAVAAAATDNGYGWRPDSFKVIVVLSAGNFAGTEANSDILNKLVAGNVVPVFATKASSSSFTAVVNSLKFGAATLSLQNPQTNWATRVQDGISNVVKEIVVKARGNDVRVVSALPAKATGNPGQQVTVKVGFKKPAGVTFSNLPEVTLVAMGWGTSTVSVNINRAPVAHPTTVITNEDTPKGFTLVVDDPDRNKLEVTFTSLPAKGVIKVGGQVAQINTKIEVAAMTYEPAANDYTTTPYQFTYTVSDRCMTSNVATGTVTINSVNDPPSASDLNIKFKEDEEMILDFTNPPSTLPPLPPNTPISDIDDATSTLKTFIATLPTSIVKLQQVSGEAVTGGSLVNGNRVKVVGLPNQHGRITFTYYVKDVQGAVSPTRTVTVDVENVPNPPTIRASSTSLQVERDSDPAKAGKVTITVQDYDASEELSLVVTSCNRIAAANDLEVFKVVEGATSANLKKAPLEYTHMTSTTPTKITNFLFQSQFVVHYLPPKLLDSQCDECEATLTVKAKDKTGLFSNEITINFIPAQEPPPVPLPPYRFDGVEDTIVDIVISASHSTLATTILPLLSPVVMTEEKSYTPTHNPGTLYYEDSNVEVPISTTSQIPNRSLLTGTGNQRSLNLKYRPAPNFYGTVTFNVQWAITTTPTSTKLESSVNQQYTISITNVNDAPESDDVTVQMLEDTSFTIDNIPARDIDNAPEDLKLVIVKSIEASKGTLVTGSGGVKVEDNSDYPGPPSNWVFTYTPPPNEYSEPETPYTFFTFKIVDAAGLESAIHEYNIIVENVDDAPYSNDLELFGFEDVLLEIVIPAFDYDLPDLDYAVAVINVPLSFTGTLYFDEEMTKEVFTGNKTDTGRTLYYLPPLDEWSYKAGDENITEPLTSFTFYILTDIPGRSLTSPSYNVDIHIESVNDPPKFDGPFHRTIREDTVEDFILIGYDDSDDPRSLLIHITELPVRGKLTDVKLTANDESVDIDNNNCCFEKDGHFGFKILSESGLVTFTPRPDEFGMNYANFTFSLTDSENATSSFTFTIDVEPVNDPPVLLADFTLPVVMEEDTEIALSFHATDVDHPLSELTAAITTIPNRGRIFACEPNTEGGCIRGGELQKVGSSIPLNVSSTKDAFWQIVFVPDENQFAFTYAVFALSAYDGDGARSDPVLVTVRVNPVNDPPVLGVVDFYETFIVDPLPLKVNVSDPDAVNKPIKFTATLQEGSHGNITIIDEKAFMPRSDSYTQEPLPPHCTKNSDSTYIECLCAQTTINNYLENLVYTPSGSSLKSVTIKFLVDDLGNIGPVGGPGLTDERNITVTIREITLIVEPDSNLTYVVIAAVVAGLAIAAIAALIIRKKLAKVDDDYFEAFDTTSGEGVLESPLYKESGSSGINPLHRLSRMNAEEIYNLDHGL